MKTAQLHFKWTVSRGRDTYGYNICTLLVDGVNKGKTVGGGYDMKGTVFGAWLQSDYQSNLIEAFAIQMKQVDELAASNERFVRVGVDDYYGAFIVGKKGALSIHLDGGCGFESMKRIATHIGITLKWNPESDRYKNHTYYTAIIN